MFNLISHLAIFVFALSAFSPWSAYGAQEAASRKTLQRQDDPVVLKFSELPALLGKDPATIRLYRYEKQKLAAIPFQIDEVDDNGRYHPAETDEKATPGPSPAQTLSRVDPLDELVFMARDTGPRLHNPQDKKAWPAWGLKNILAIEEIVVEDAAAKTQAWVYLTVESEPSAASPHSYVTYQSETKQIEGETYRLRQDCINLESLQIRKSDGSFAENILDRLKVRYRMQFMNHLIDYTYSEKRFKKKILWQKAGPVRFIQVLRVTPVLLFGIEMPSAVLNSMFYRNFYTANVVVDLFIAPKRFCSHADFAVYYDFLEKAGPFEMRGNKLSGQKVLIDGKMSEDEKAIVQAPGYFWSVVQQSESKVALFGKATKVPGFESTTPTPYLQYLDDVSKKDAPESEKGCYGCTGFMVDTIPLSKGRYPFLAHYFFLSDFNDGDENKYISLIDQPLRAKSSGTKRISNPE